MIYHTFSEDIQSEKHAKTMLFTSTKSGSWKPLSLHPPPRESNSLHGDEAAVSVGETITTVTLKTLALAGSL